MTPTGPTALPNLAPQRRLAIAGYDVELAGLSMLAGIASLATAAALVPGGV